MKRCIIKKFVFGRSITDALKKEKRSQVEEICLDSEYEEKRHKQLEPALGFSVPSEDKEKVD